MTALAAATTVVLEIAVPFDWGSQLDFLTRRAVAGVETVVDGTYSRTLRLPRGPAVLSVSAISSASASGSGSATASDSSSHSAGQVLARLQTCDGGDAAAAGDLSACVTLCRGLLDLDADSTRIDAHLARDDRLAASVRAHPGLRVTGHVDGFEVAVRAVVGQQISVAGARTVLARLVVEHGELCPTAEPGLTRLFPTADVLAEADPETLPMPRARGRSLVGLAAAVARGDLALDRGVDAAETRSRLLALPGIGPWTADYIAMRALGDPDVFLGTDLGVRQGLARLGFADSNAENAARWRPWRSYALMHVWKSLEPTATHR